MTSFHKNTQSAPVRFSAALRASVPAGSGRTSHRCGFRNHKTMHSGHRPFHAGILILLLTALCFSVMSCDSIPFFGGGKDKKAAPKPKQKPGVNAATPGAAAPGQATGTAVFGEYNDQLIADADLDQFKGQFNAEVGRDNPFAFVPYSVTGVADIEDGMKENPDLYRVIGTARTTPSGPAALIQMGTETFIVHEGDEIDKATIKHIDLRDVTIEMSGKEFVLSMRTRTRTLATPDAPGIDQTELGKLAPKMDALGSLYEEYLSNKYGEKDFVQEDSTKSPQTFTQYLQKKEETTYQQKENPF